MLPPASVPRQEWSVQREADEALREVCLGYFAITAPKSQPGNAASRAAFVRRYKWAGDLPTELKGGIPDFDAFVAARDALPAGLGHHSPEDAIARGKRRLLELSEGTLAGMAEHWTDERRKFYALVVDTTNSGAEGQLIWDVKRNPWFPVSQEASM